LSIDKALNCRVNISSAIETRIVDLYKVIAAEMNSLLELEIRPPILGEVARSALDNQRAQTLLGWSPKVTLENGVALSIRNETNETK
jgi:UDP-glucose 4-epimerase